MDLIKELITNWQGIVTLVTGIIVAFGMLLSSINSLLKFIAPLTPWSWDNNLADVLGKLVANKIFQKKE